MDDLRRQFRLALVALVIIIPIGVTGFMFLEKLTFIDALWLTFITLATIGYGDIYARSEAGRLFTIVLVIFGLSALASTLQAAFTFFISPEIRATKQRKRMYNAIGSLRKHYILCGKGEVVDKTVGYLLQFAETRRQMTRQVMYESMDKYLNRVFGENVGGQLSRVRSALRQFILGVINLWRRESTILDVVVVITDDEECAVHLRSAGLLVLEGNPSDTAILRQAGIDHARALVVALDNDTETLLTVLTAHNLNAILPITAAVLDEELGQKIVRVGANAVLTPYDIAGQFLNNATFRPAVNDFFNSLLFDSATHDRMTQIELFDNSPWIGQTISALNLRERFEGGIVGIRQSDGAFAYAPHESYVLQEDEVLIAVAKGYHIEEMQQESRGANPKHHIPAFQPLHFHAEPPRGRRNYTLAEAEIAIQNMSGHFIICGTDRVSCSSINKLNPERPFVIISDDDATVSELIERGFRIVKGNPAHESTLVRAGIKRAQAIMVSLEDKADSILTILGSRTMNKRILITATAMTDEMVDKLERAGADRVVSPFHVAARFILLTATRPEISEFLNHVIFNYTTGLEATELYMEDNSPWIGRTIGELQLHERYRAGIIGLRLADKHSYLYAPPEDYAIQSQEVVIAVTPMETSDALRDDAHGSAGKRPVTLRRQHVLQSDQWSRDILKELIERGQGAD